MQQHSQRPFTRVPRACDYCRSRKVKCDGVSPCGNCVDHRKNCNFSPLPPRRHKTDANKPKARDEHVENIVVALPGDSVNSSARPGTRKGHVNVPIVALTPDSQPPPRQHNLTDPTTWIGCSPDVDARGLLRMDPPTVWPTTTTAISVSPTGSIDHPSLAHSLPTPESSSSVVDREEIVIAPENVIWEHQGPVSWASICSGPGQRWVHERNGAKDFAESAQRLILAWARRLKVPRGATRERCVELDVERAWKYTNAYFEQSHDRIFGVVYRPDFEARLRQHFENGCPINEDAAWYALRNAVYAEGCRSAGCKESGQNFSKIQAEAARYFENAVSVLTELLFTQSDLMAVQAVVVMTAYAEGLGSSALEYILCAMATRFAQSKGLHRQPSKAWNLPADDIIHRNWLFWAIYCYEKYIVLRSGRPSSLDDDDISCEIPDTTVLGSTIDITIFTNVIKHAQICSIISKRLSSVRAFKQNPEELVDTVRHLSTRLDHWWEALPGHLTSPMATEHALRFHHSYYGSMIALHANFAYPWIRAMLGCGAKSQAFREQIMLSSKAAADAARQILGGTRRIEPDVSSPAWLVFYFPMLGVINLFIYILKYPTLSSVHSDLALLDIATGHFGHVKLLTASELEFTFPREIATLAYDVVQRFSKTDSVGTGPSPVGTTSSSREKTQTPGAMLENDADGMSWHTVDMLDSIDIDFETWNTHSPWESWMEFPATKEGCSFNL